MIIAETQMSELPESCVACDMFRKTASLCTAKQVWFGMEDFHWLPVMRPEWCPLREVEMQIVKVKDEGVVAV